MIATSNPYLHDQISQHAVTVLLRPTPISHKSGKKLRNIKENENHFKYLRYIRFNENGPLPSIIA